LFAEGSEIASTARGITGERDPLHGPRSREQMQELVIWLARGEIHEYYLRAPQLTFEAGRAAVIADLWPAALGGAPEPRPDLSQQLAQWMASPDVTEFFVHLRMPRRFSVAFTLENGASRDRCVVEARPGEGSRSARVFDIPSSAQDRMAEAVTIQI
jgi:hypothetical protein